ncbi:MAG TPA: TetR/AcrR family transcriptional regulator, partial [Pyrinomonadaceae bacterium]|nr:TetR/AcrR family transcriptional regulator [Pyrinomonadaceae bacterium]
KEIAQSVGVSEAMLFRHFATKDKLYAAILDDKVSQNGNHKFPWEGDEALLAAMRVKDDFTVFYTMAYRALEKHQSDQGFLRLLLYSALEGHNLAEAFFRDFVSQIYTFLGNYIKERQADGVMREVDPRIVVRAFMGMMIHHSLNNILWDKRRHILEISNEEAARNFAEILLRGVLK